MAGEAPDTDVLVIGGGVVGLAIARSILCRGREVLLIERHGKVGTETSSRNSEVIHAGLYYPPGSLRARLCVAGKNILYKFAADNGIPVQRIGKLLVATSEAEVPRLEAIAVTAARNGVDDLQKLTSAEARRLEPEVDCVSACFSPSTGIIDSHALVQSLEGHVSAEGGMIVLNSAATRIEKNSRGLFRVHIESGGELTTLVCRSVVVAAGHGASALLSTFPFDPPYTVPNTYPAIGHYYSIAGRPPFQHLVYPMPQGAWLGLHYTLDTGGRCRFGPDIERHDSLSLTFDDSPGRRQTFEREIRRYWPGLPDNALTPDFTSARPKIYPEGATPADFAIHGTEVHGVDGLIALLGIESPGLTASLAIGEFVACRLVGD